MIVPDGWVIKTIGEVTEPIQKVDPSRNPDVGFIYLDISLLLSHISG